MNTKFALFVFCLITVTSGHAQEPVVTSSEIEQALQQPKTRSLTRGVSVRAKVDLYIPFELNSARLVPEAEKQLSELGDALGGDSLAAYRFEIAGHTDASGAADYNLSLSERRAEAVMRYLLVRGVAAERLKAIGYGEERLLHEDRPMDAANRRVEIRNLGAVTQ
jgi:outer membrane protein OmpA-like peptidoglycan-associated protein